MLQHCFTLLFLLLQARCIAVLPPDGGNRALQSQFILQNNTEGQKLEEVECINSGSRKIAMSLLHDFNNKITRRHFGCSTHSP